MKIARPLLLLSLSPLLCFVPGCGGTNAGGGADATEVGAGGAAGAATAQGGDTASAGGAAGATGAVATAKNLTTEVRQVPPGAEIYGCQDFQNPFGKDVAITQSTAVMTAGSHHMFAFVLSSDMLSLFDGLADCPAGGVEFHDYVHTSQVRNDVITYPPGVGRLLPASMGFRVMIHLLNTSPDPIAANVAFGMNYVDPGMVANKAASMFLNNLGLKVPVGASTQTATFTVPSDITMLRAGSHMHRHGSHFVATTSDGVTLYESTTWDEPVPRVFDPPLAIAAGTRITWACDFQNDSGAMLKFGESAANNEMCIFPASFYDGIGNQMNAQYPFF